MAVQTNTQQSSLGDDFRLFAPNGFIGQIGGNGMVFGTSGFEHITFAGQVGWVGFDPSFNRGGDLLEFPGSASDYTAVLNGSLAVFNNSGATYSIPISTVGIQLLFEDGVRTLILSSGIVKLGSQIIGTEPEVITAPSDNSLLSNFGDASVEARIFLADEASVSLGGNLRVFGTAGVEEITYLGGNIVLDPSFNRGGDTLFLADSPSAYSAYVSGSLVVILTTEGQITIPIGTDGMVINFGNEERVLRFDSASASVMIGDVSLSGSSALSPIPLDTINGVIGATVSLDIGSGAIVETVSLQEGVSYVFTDDADKNTNVVIEGFDSDDRIQVTGANASDYNFSSSDADGDSIGDDLMISFSDGSTFNVITIINGASSPGIIADLATAQAAVGHNFIAFPDDTDSGSVVDTIVIAVQSQVTVTEVEPQEDTPTIGGGLADSVSLDVGTGAIVETIILQDGVSYVLTDDAGANTNVEIIGFDGDDVIEIIGVNASDYNFSTGDADGDSVGDDLKIGFSDENGFTLITILDVASPMDIVANLATAEAAVGHSFITFA